MLHPVALLLLPAPSKSILLVASNSRQLTNSMPAVVPFSPRSRTQISDCLACAAIRAACEQAGFVQGGARTGDGLFVDCIAPIIRQTRQPPRASRPLPKIDLQLVADCKAQNPNFGQRNAPPSQAAQPPAQSSPLPRAVTPQVAPAQQRNAPPSQAVVPPASPTRISSTTS